MFSKRTKRIEGITMNQIQKLIAELILDARNGKTGLTNLYHSKFNVAIEKIVEDEKKVIELRLEHLLESLKGIKGLE